MLLKYCIVMGLLVVVVDVFSSGLSRSLPIFSCQPFHAADGRRRWPTRRWVARRSTIRRQDFVTPGFSDRSENL